MQKAADELDDRGIRNEVRVMSAHRDPDVVADYCKNAHMRGLKVIIAGAGPGRRAAGRRRGAHRPAGDRRAADQRQLGGRRARRDAGDRPDAAGRAGRLRGGQRRAQRGDPRAKIINA